ncbi:MAG TPA: GNAT family N-acetyltransferase [Candidatus Limnocylindria bacterium]
MTTDIRIRPMRPTDAMCVAELATQLGYASSPDDILHRLAELAGHPAVALVAVDTTDEVIGWIQVERTPSLAVSDAALIGGLVIDERHRSAGVGAALLDAGEAWAREHGVRTMVVSSRIAREGAHRFYEREGYERLKTSHIFAKELV